MSQPQQLCSIAMLLLAAAAAVVTGACGAAAAALSHLCCSCDHVLHVICVTWAVHVCVVTLLRLVLNCSSTAVQSQHMFVNPMPSAEAAHCWVQHRGSSYYM
jgi:branched-subunit amino acid ABC-type transport system permease component